MDGVWCWICKAEITEPEGDWREVETDYGPAHHWCVETAQMRWEQLMRGDIE